MTAGPVNGVPSDVWVLYRLRDDDTEEFFVLSHRELAREQSEWNFPGEKLSYAEHVERVVKRVDNVVASSLDAHRNRWEKIERFLAPQAERAT